MRLLMTVTLIASGLLAGCKEQKKIEKHVESPYKWIVLVETLNHANPIPKEWLATAEGRFAHDLKIPNPVPADSGYKDGMKPAEYYQLLCDKEAGEFTFKTVNGVDGLYFARPPLWPNDDDLKGRWKLEHPRVESKFQLMRDTPVARAHTFVNPPFVKYRFYEEPNLGAKSIAPYLRMSGYQQDMRDQQGNFILRGTPMTDESVSDLKSRYGMTWRGIHRPHDRENGVAGGEVIIYDVRTNEVLYVFRNFAFSGRTNGTPDGIWWLNSGGCQKLHRELDHLDAGLSNRATEILKPNE